MACQASWPRSFAPLPSQPELFGWRVISGAAGRSPGAGGCAGRCLGAVLAPGAVDVGVGQPQLRAGTAPLPRWPDQPSSPVAPRSGRDPRQPPTAAPHPKFSGQRDRAAGRLILPKSGG